MSQRRVWPSEGQFSWRFRFYALIWLVYIVFPLLSLFGLHSGLKIAVGAFALVLFVLIYVRAFIVNPPSDPQIL